MPEYGGVIRNVDIKINASAEEFHRRTLQNIAALREYEHRRGAHTYGNMRKDCPLCRSGGRA